MKAHRLARGWSRPEAIERILATYDDDGLRRPLLTPQRLCAWEHDPRVRPGEDYLDRLCRVYETRPDLLGYGHDYTPAAERAVDAAGEALQASYAGASAAPLALSSGESVDAGHDMQPENGAATTNRNEFLGGLGATGAAVLLDRASKAAVRLSRKVGGSNLSPVTIEQLELRVASIMQRYQHTRSDQRLRTILDQQEEVEALLDGHQPLHQRRALYRIAGQLSTLAGGTAFELSDYDTASTHLLTAWWFATEVGDHALMTNVRVTQSTTAFWSGDFQAALGYAQDGQRYAAGARRAQLASRCEARALVRIGERSSALDALRRADQAMPSQPVTGDPGGGYSAFSPGALELYTGISLLWLDDPKQAEVHARQAITCYETQPPLFQSPANHAQAQITLATCLIGQDQPEEAIKLAARTLQVDRARVEPNLQQAHEFLAALPPAHRNLPAAREFVEHLHTLRPLTHS